ncbi:MAG: RluA family pseudouridine synthase [Acidobacteria bacterium]|nr:RluA family pseudouridine synthase [Acidobacteriota bacterium]MCB9397433.1 RluA family pseudouridine synthase [Acidobacteriota bacterium]
MSHFSVDTPWDGARLDQFLAAQLPQWSRTKIKELIVDQKVLVDGQPRKASYLLNEGSSITAELPEDPERITQLTPEAIPLEILHEDDAILVINKPAGMVVHPGTGVYSGTLAHALVHHFAQLSQVGGALRPGIIHRLDKGTTGIILVAKTDAAHLNLTQQWQAGTVTKVYQGLVWGIPNPETGEVESHIGRHPSDRKRMAAEVEKGKQAISRYKVVEAYAEAAKVNVHILTGRTHQIRVHMAHLGHPVIGDALYGGQRHRHLKKSFPHMPEHPMLHAALLRFRHPVTDAELTFKAEPHAAFLRCIENLKAWPY